MAKAGNPKLAAFVEAHQELSTAELVTLAKKQKLNYTTSQIGYHKTKLNKSKVQRNAGNSGTIPVSELELLRQENLVLKNTIGSLLVTIGQLVRVSR